MPRYQFVTGISLSLLEEEINRMVAEEPGLALNQVLQVPGAGFVGVVERDISAPLAQPEPAEPAKPKPTKPRFARRR